MNIDSEVARLARMTSIRRIIAARLDLLEDEIFASYRDIAHDEIGEEIRLAAIRREMDKIERKGPTSAAL